MLRRRAFGSGACPVPKECAGRIALRLVVPVDWLVEAANTAHGRLRWSAAGRRQEAPSWLGWLMAGPVRSRPRRVHAYFHT
jgi:hypothetical protein